MMIESVASSEGRMGKGRRGRRKVGREPVTGLVPPECDPLWKKWATPLLSFLERPRTWDQLYSWGRPRSYSQTKMRHIVAWLESHKQVVWDWEKETWRRQ